jgi:hypothetical protein
VIDLLLAFAVIRAAEVPPEARPPFVRSAIEAIAAKDAGRMVASFDKFAEIDARGSRSISAERTIGLVSVCSEKDVRSLNAHVYVIRYECPSRPLATKSCETGALNLIVDGGQRSLAISHERKISESCPRIVPIVKAVGSH